jgi:excisionase family DNA binding protein
MEKGFLAFYNETEFEAFFEKIVYRCLKGITLNEKSHEKKWLSHSDASNYLGLPSGTLYKLTSARQINYTKRGKRNFFLIDDLDAWMQKGRRKTGDEIKLNAKFTLKK